MSTHQILITGSNRGIGLEFVRQYADAGCRVIACCRDPHKADALNALAASAAGSISVRALDVGDFGQIERLSIELRGQAIDLLINNAGVYPRSSFGSIDYAHWHTAFQINTMAPMRMVECFVEHVAASDWRKLVTISSSMGSIEGNDSGGSTPYRTSKAAVNMLMKNLTIELESRGIVTLTLHPGWVKTDMGGANALISTQQSVTGMRSLIDRLSAAISGKFVGYDGKEIPW
jgi:NAD(P)-dependent dehydrogenase (short-subunit alcohol dehydrogenase family)